MPIAFTETGPIFFVHVPKTGGTSMEDYLLRRFGPLALTDVNKQHGVRGTYLMAAVNHLSAIDLREMIPVQSILVFALVRDPLQRLLSEYRWQSGASRMSRLSFSSWLRVMDACVRIDPRAYGNHVRPQADLVPAGAEVFRLEDGFGPAVARIDAVTNSIASNIEVGYFKARRKAQDDIPVFREDAALIRGMHGADYDRFCYPAPALSEYPPDPHAALRGLVGRGLARGVMWRQRRRWLQ